MSYRNKGYVSAQITIMAALTIIVIISLILTAIQSAMINTLRVKAKHACELSIEGLFAQYNNKVLDKYDVLLLKKSDNVDGTLSKYIKENLSGNISLANSSISNITCATDNGGDPFRKEVIDYMKYGIYSDVVDRFNNSKQEIERSKKLNEITDIIASCEDEIFSIDAKTLELVRLVEGVDTTESGFVIKSNSPVKSEDNFVKSIVYEKVSMNSCNIDNEKIYNTVAKNDSRYISIKDILEDMEIIAQDCLEYGDDTSDSNTSHKSIYKRDYDKLDESLNEVMIITEKAMELSKDYEGTKQNVLDRLKECEAKIVNNKAMLGEDLSNGLLDDVSDMMGACTDNKRTLCDMKLINEAIVNKYKKLTSFCGEFKSIDSELTQNSASRILEKLNSLKEVGQYINNNGLHFDYSNVDFDSKNTGMDAIKKIYKTLTDGLLGLVIDDVENISDKKITIKDIASNFCGESGLEESFTKETVDTALFDEYVLSHFYSYSDYLEEKSNTYKKSDNKELLDFMVEYILCGKDNDVDNLKATMIELSLIREGMNIGYLLTDRVKKQEAFALATSLLGFTGNAGIIKAGQYLILTVWAYGETIMELRDLYKGEKVEFVKKKENWQLDLESLLKMSFETKDLKKNNSGLLYEDYLRMLLLVEGSVKKNYRTMGAIELHMISEGENDFRMKNQIVEMTCMAEFNIRNSKSLYRYDFEYSY